VLKHPVLTFDDEAIALAGAKIVEEIRANGYTCYACAVLPDHVHLLIRRHRDWAETMIERFQTKTRQALIAAGKRAVTHPVWTKGPGWKGFLNTRDAFRRDVKYIEDNPRKIGRPAQVWDFVVPYDGWLPPRRG
jgi:REP element-mobilizing transposase RayT